MAGICCGVVSENEPAAPTEPSSRTSRRRRLQLRPSFKLVADVAVAPPLLSERKRQKLEVSAPSLFASEKRGVSCEGCKVEQSQDRVVKEHGEEQKNEGSEVNPTVNSNSKDENPVEFRHENPKFGMTAVCGRRRDMEDAVSIHPSFCEQNGNVSSGTHFFGVFDGHGCSHVRVQTCLSQI